MDILYNIFINPFVQMGTAPDLFFQTLWEGAVAGTLYALALSGLKWLGAITPIGGSAMIAAWLWVAVTALRRA